MGFIYLIAFYVAARQLVPLVGASGLTPVHLFFQRVASNPAYGDSLSGFFALPSLFWLNDSDFMLELVPWIGVLMSCVVMIGYANALMMTVLWACYVSIVHAGQSWYGYGWEIQMSETGSLCIFLCPLLDGRPFSSRPPPIQIIWLFRWLIVRIMLGSALIKWRGDSCWRDLTALYYHFETQPIPNPFSRFFHFLPHPILQFGVIWTFIVELVAPFFCFWPRQGRHVAAVIIISFQLILIVSGNLSFFNWLTILPALACFDDRCWRRLMPNCLTGSAVKAQLNQRSSPQMDGLAWVVVVLVGFLSLEPVLNLVAPGQGGQAMNASFTYDSLHLVNTYGAFGTVGRDRLVLIFEGTDSDNPDEAADWKEYPYVGSPWNPKLCPPFLAPYQPHLDWQLWFAAMSNWERYPWTLNLVWKLLHNDREVLGLFAGNPFPDQPPHFVRALLYQYRFASPGNPDGLYWTRERKGLWLPALSVQSQVLTDILHEQGWLN